MNPYALMAGLVSVVFVAGSAVAADLNQSTIIWTARQSPGTNSVAHANGRAYVAGGTKLQAIALDSVGEVEGEDEMLGEVEIDTTRFGAITSVAAHGDLVAVSVTNRASKTAPGSVLIYRYPGLELEHVYGVGVGPDMLTFSWQIHEVASHNCAAVQAWSPTVLARERLN